mmetsp:Transcript_153873/g.268156  ORF Transcript_153873/g.268156 Transcript_153873/m.268156 type:complete len:205 (-) Transcript_153873:1-615(-)
MRSSCRLVSASYVSDKSVRCVDDDAIKCRSVPKDTMTMARIGQNTAPLNGIVKHGLILGKLSCALDKAIAARLKLPPGRGIVVSGATIWLASPDSHVSRPSVIRASRMRPRTAGMMLRAVFERWSSDGELCCAAPGELASVPWLYADVATGPIPGIMLVAFSFPGICGRPEVIKDGILAHSVAGRQPGAVRLIRADRLEPKCHL